MNVCLAALIPLLACLLVFPPDVSGRRVARQELKEKKDEYEVSRIRKRANMHFPEYFKKPHLARTCEVCHELYGIQKGECLAAKKHAMQQCLAKARADRANFIAKWHGTGGHHGAKGHHHAGAKKHHAAESGERKLALGSVDEYFKAPHLKKTCTACSVVGGVNFNNCMAGVSDGRQFCRMTIGEMRVRFNVAFSEAPADRKKMVK